MNQLKKFLLANVSLLGISAFVLTLVPIFPYGDGRSSIYAILYDRFLPVTMLFLTLYAISSIYCIVLIFRKRTNKVFFYAAYVFLPMTVLFFLSTIMLVVGTI
ncbi:MAG: hypothetical protein J5993_03605 [Clostridia bacterium]|nr:hypothetical protein [Clostridia bacterium]